MHIVLSNFLLLIWRVLPRENKTEDKSPNNTQVCGNSVNDDNTFLKEKNPNHQKTDCNESQPDLFKGLIHLLLVTWPWKRKLTTSY
jgi:hypothetical protein